MNDKQQLAAMGEHMAEQAAQPMCMAKRIEELDVQVRVMAELLRDLHEYIGASIPQTISEHYRGCDLLERIDAVLAGKLPDPAVTVTETIRTAPEHIWLQVGDQSHYHSEPFPLDTGGVTWCADSVVGCEVTYVRADLVGRHHVAPEGWQLMPVEPTEKMIDESIDAGRFDEDDAVFFWASMLAAAPSLDSAK